MSARRSRTSTPTELREAADDATLPSMRILALAIVSICLSGAVPQAKAPALSEDFEASGPVATRLLRDPRLAIAEGKGVGGGRALQAAYVGGPMGSERLVNHMPLGQRGLEYTLNYDVKFADDFQFVGGGKLHGLGPDKPVTGGDPIRPDGWSARVMWREKGRVELYTYHQDQKDKYGDHGEVVRETFFAPGCYYAVSLHVRVNSEGDRTDGFIRLYIDGVLVEQHEKLRLRGTDEADTLISGFLFSTFHGGNDSGWAPKNADGSYATVHAWFDNFAVWPGERVRNAPGQ